MLYTLWTLLIRLVINYLIDPGSTAGLLMTRALPIDERPSLKKAPAKRSTAKTTRASTTRTNTTKRASSAAAKTKRTSTARTKKKRSSFSLRPAFRWVLCIMLIGGGFLLGSERFENLPISPVWRERIAQVLQTAGAAALGRATASTTDSKNTQNLSKGTVFSGKTVSVADGDTISVMYQKSPVKLRLYGIDCPESKQDYGTKAKQFTSSFVFGKTVKVKIHNKDLYGRFVAEVFVGNASLNEALVKEGLAWWYQAYAKTDRRFETLEKQARAAKRGLWAAKKPIPPWDFRKGS